MLTGGRMKVQTHTMETIWKHKGFKMYRRQRPKPLNWKEANNKKDYEKIVVV